MRAASHGHADIVDLLIAARAEVNAVVAGITPLMAACMQAPVDAACDTALALLRAGADPNAVDRFRETPLMKAAARGLTDVMLALINAKADVNAQDNEEHTPLYHAALSGRKDAVKCLLQSGADELAQKQALAVAEAKELKDIIAILAPEAAEPEEEELVLPERYAFAKKVLAELPSGDGRVGFPSDVPLLLSGVGLRHYADALLAAGFGAAQVVTAGDKQLRDAGVRFASQRLMIMNGMLRLAVHGWGKGCLPDAETITSAVHAVSTAIRQLHLMWATTVLGRTRGDPDLEEEPDLEKKTSAKTVVVTTTVIREADEIRRRAASIARLAGRKVYADPAAPADLIRPSV